MANPTPSELGEEFLHFAAPFVDSGRFHDPEEVMRAAMDALRLTQVDEDALNSVLFELAQEGEASGEAEGDIFEAVRAKYGLVTSLQK